MESSILVEQYSTVNIAIERISVRRGDAAVMAVTAALLGRHSRYVVFKQGN